MAFMKNLHYQRRRDRDLPTHKSDHEARNAKATSKSVPWRDRIRHFTFAWFTTTMATGGIALLLFRQPHSFRHLQKIGLAIFLLDLVLFVTFTCTLTARFVIHKGTFLNAIRHPTEALFLPTFLLSIVNILACASSYGTPSIGPWLPGALRICFWLYLSAAFILAVGQYLYLFTAPPTRLTIQSMTPAWILPIFPSMLCGTLAATILPHQKSQHRLSIALAGLTMQGLGWSVALLMYSAWIQRLLQYGLPAPDLRPGMFIAIGPPFFTGLALIGLSKNLPTNSEAGGYFAAHPNAAETLQYIALFTAVFLWCLALWFWCISLVSVLTTVQKMEFHLIWYSLVFPNVGFTLALITIGEELGAGGIQWVGSGLTALVVATWVFVIGMHVRAVCRKEILMEGRNEDKDQYKEDDRKEGIPIPP